MLLGVLVFELRCFDFIGTRNFVAFCDGERFSVAAAA